MALKKEFHSTLIPALDALIGNPDILRPNETTKLKADLMVIPAQYVSRVRDFRHEVSNRGEASTKILDTFSKILESIHQSSEDVYHCANGMDIIFLPESEISLPPGSDSHSSVANALATARHLIKNGNKDVAIFTGDNSMISLAYLNDIDVARVSPEVYTGRRKVVMPETLYDSWFNKGLITKSDFEKYLPEEEPLRLNEFIEFTFDDYLKSTYCTSGYIRNSYVTNIGRFEPYLDEDKNEYCIYQLHYIEDLPRDIQPRTAGQAMLAEALMAPVEEIPIVICPSVFGTGKTFLATAIGLYLTAGKDPQYERIFVCPRDSELGKEIGFLPGTEHEKTLAKAMPIVDNIRAYVKLRGDRSKGGADMSSSSINNTVDSLIEKHFELVSIINMGGRSISDSWIIYDEAQDMERFQINQLMKRIGDGSKMIIMGDPHQIYNRHMNYHSNGLSYAATKMAGSPYAAIISMQDDEITRSTAAQEISRLLDH